ncbi:MAG: TonB system transport protein ExbD [Helicobacter sp.]|nr:TonB system transport protein ExbD [Helicobacter sp.]MCI7485321.1 TonB system transport protein ExbD [Helicobacter sp.]MDD7567926.1 TonB system transport protein ExbD [Helicobacter sp.]MDY5741243.1 TonB system transport protein ExbD [Helicobacter sp.]
MRLPKKDGLNVIPLIDVMLVLLAIVLSVSTFIAQGQIKVELPSSNQSSAPTDSPVVTLSINENGEIFFENEAVSIEILKTKIFALTPKTLLKLEIDKNARFDIFVQIADILKEKGHENVSIATSKK